MGAHAIISVHPPARSRERDSRVERTHRPPRLATPEGRLALPRARALGSHAALPPSAVASRLGDRLLRHQRRPARNARGSKPGERPWRRRMRLAAQRKVVRARALRCADVDAQHAQHAQHAQREGRRRRGDRGGLPDPRGCGVGATGHARQRPRARRRAGATARGRAGAGWSARPVRSGKRGGGLGAAGEGGEVARYARYAGMGARGRGLWRAAPPPRRLSSAV